MDQGERKFTEIRLPVPWGHVAVKAYGPSKDMKILMVHGILDNAGSFDRLIMLLPEEYQYVSVDLPGHGLSSHFPPGMPLNFFNYVHTIHLVLDALEWKTCMYIGHSLGAQLGIYFSILYPGRLTKIIALDGMMPVPIEDCALISCLQERYNIENYSKNGGLLYTEEEILYALKFKRFMTLNSEAAKALFKRGVSKVNNLYKYNRDARLRTRLAPFMNMNQHYSILQKLSTSTLIIAANGSNRLSRIYHIVKAIEFSVNDKNKFCVIPIPGNHDVHNNNPERVAPHICKYLSNDLKSKL